MTPTRTRWWFWIFLYVHPENWGNHPIWQSYFSNGLVQPPTRNATNQNVFFPMLPLVGDSVSSHSNDFYKSQPHQVSGASSKVVSFVESLRFPGKTVWWFWFQRFLEQINVESLISESLFGRLSHLDCWWSLSNKTWWGCQPLPSPSVFFASWLVGKKTRSNKKRQKFPKRSFNHPDWDFQREFAWSSMGGYRTYFRRHLELIQARCLASARKFPLPIDHLQKKTTY